MDFPDKSGKTPPEQPKKEIKPLPVHVVEAKRPATRRFMDLVFAESPGQVVSRITRESLVPQLKIGFVNAFNSFVAGMVLGEGSSQSLGNMVRGTVLRGGVNTYHNISSMPNPALAQAMAAVQRPAGSYEDIITATVPEAEMILANLIDILNQYRMVSVADLKEMTNRSTNPGDDAYGWTSLDGSRISRVKAGYQLELPRTTLIS